MESVLRDHEASVYGSISKELVFVNSGASRQDARRKRGTEISWSWGTFYPLGVYMTLMCSSGLENIGFLSSTWPGHIA